MTMTKNKHCKKLPARAAEFFCAIGGRESFLQMFHNKMKQIKKPR